jgi:hypothetical protein
MPNKGTVSGYTAKEVHKATRWTLVVKPIKREFMKDGVRYYETIDRKIWQADIFDSKLVAPKGKILPRFIAQGTELKGTSNRR